MSIFGKGGLIDRNTKDLQKGTQNIIDQTRNVIDQNTDTLTKSNPFDLSKLKPLNLSGTSASGGGKGAPSYSVPSIDLSSLQPNLDQNFAEPVQPLIDATVDVTTQVPVQAVEGLTSIDAGKTATDVVTQAVTAPEQIIGDAEPAVSAVADATADTIITATKVPEKINQIDAGKVAEDVVNQAVTTVTETPKMVVKIAEDAFLKPASGLNMYLQEEAKNAAELAWDNLMSPFQPGETQGTEGAGNPQLSADTPNLGDNQVFGDLEKATGKDSKLTEEERLRRIRRLLLNRYGRENTILTTGPGDTKSRRRYAL